MKKIIALISILALLTGCAGANISSQIRASGEDGSSKMIRCIDFTTGYENKTNSQLQKYDGWKMVYVSEYTTPNKSSSAAVMCFEKPYSK